MSEQARLYETVDGLVTSLVERFVGREKSTSSRHRKAGIDLAEWTQECRVAAFAACGEWMRGTRRASLEIRVMRRVKDRLVKMNHAWDEGLQIVSLDGLLGFSQEDVYAIDRVCNTMLDGLAASLAGRPDEQNRSIVDAIGQIQVDAFAGITPGGERRYYRRVGEDIVYNCQPHPYSQAVMLENQMMRDHIADTRRRIAAIVSVRIMEITRREKKAALRAKAAA